MKAQKIETVPIESIIPYTLNSKVHTAAQIDRIANSISQFGMNAPIVIDDQNIILAGHGRWQAMQKLGMKEVPVIRKNDLTDTQKRAYRVIDNKTSSDTGYDFENLQLELKTLEELQFDSKMFGFEEFEFPEPPGAPSGESDGGGSSAGEWVGQIKLKVPAQEIDHFEADLDELIKKYDGISKETKRVK